MATRHLALAWMLLTAGCTDGAYVIEVELSPALAERTRAIELSLVLGGCDDGQTPGAPVAGAIQRRVLERDGPRPSFSPAEPGRYGVHGLARDAQCAPVAAGCEEYTLEPGGSGTLRLPLAAVDGEACGACDDGVCGDAFDAGVRDGGSPDGGMDGGVRDGGMDGGGMDGGRDAGAPDAGFDAGPPSTLCPIPGAIFCDGFEQWDPAADAGRSDAGPRTWVRRVRDGGAVTVVTEVNDGGDVYLGAKSAKMTTPTDVAQAAAVYGFDSPITTGDLWVRAFVYVPSTFELTGFTLLYLAPGTNGEGVAVQVAPTALMMLFEAPGQSEPADSALPLDQWACIELHIVVADSGSAELYLEGTSTGWWPTDTLPTNGIQGVLIGMENPLDGQGPAEVFIDEVAISRSRLGCR